MFVFGCAVTDESTFARCFAPGYRRTAEPDSLLIEDRDGGTVSQAYNRILDRAATLRSVEAVVLVHQDLEIVSDDFCARLRRAMAHPRVGVVGCAGAVDVTSIAWWDPGPVVGAYEWIYDELGSRVQMQSWDHVREVSEVTEVAAVDGMLLALSPAALGGLRFDPELDPGAHAYDVDICFQAREAGLKVVVAPLGVAHHHGIVILDDPSDWIDAHQRFARKWARRLAIPAGARWEDEARLADARRGAAEVARNQLSMLRNLADERAVEAERDQAAARAEAEAARAQAAAANARLESITRTRAYRAAAAARSILDRAKLRRGSGG